jgi:hypothetical protein
MDPLIQLDLGRQHLWELRNAAADASFARTASEAASRPAAWRRTIGRILIASGHRLSDERLSPCLD